MCSDRGETAPRVGGQSPTESIFVSQPPQPLSLSTTTPPCNNHHDLPSPASTNNHIPTTHSWTFFNYATATAYQHRQCHCLPICFFGWAGLSIPTSSPTFPQQRGSFASPLPTTNITMITPKYPIRSHALYLMNPLHPESKPTNLNPPFPTELTNSECECESHLNQTKSSSYPLTSDNWSQSTKSTRRWLYLFTPAFPKLISYSETQATLFSTLHQYFMT